MIRPVVLLVLLTGCGYEAVNSEMIGQVKKIGKETPLICPNYNVAEFSLGVMRNGVGSMSTEDVNANILNEEDENILRTAAETGKLVKVHYNKARIRFCTNDRDITKVELVK